MSTPLLIHTVIPKYVRFFQNGKSHSVKWDGKSLEMILIQKERKLLLWYFNMLVECGTVLLIVYITLRQIFSPTIKIPTWIILFQVILGFLGTMAIGAAFGIRFHGTNVVLSWNHLLRITRRKEVAKFGHSSSNYVILGHCLGLLLYICLIGPPVCVCFSVLFNIDPFYYIFSDPVTPLNLLGRNWTAVDSIPLRLVGLYICGNEIATMGAVAPLFPMLFHALLNDFNSRAVGWYRRSLHSPYGTLKIIRLFNQLQLTLNIAAPITEHLIGFAMGMGFGLFIVSNFAAFKLITTIPFPPSLAPPIISFIMFFLNKAIIHLALQSHHSSAQLLKELRTKTGTSRFARSYLLRKIAALKPFDVYFGVGGYRVFKFKRSTKSTFDFSVLSYTINALISVPTAKLL